MAPLRQRSAKSILLLGPRQTGKSTLVGQLDPDLTINLFHEPTYLEFARNPRDIVTGATEHVNTRLVLTLVSGTGIVIDTGGNPANNGNGDIQKLFRIAGNTFSVRVAVTSNHLTIPTFGPSNSHVFNAIHHPPMTNSMTAVNTGFYYLQCTP